MPTLHGSPEEILQLHQDLENSHIPNYNLQRNESSIPHDINLNNLNMDNLLQQDMPSTIGQSSPLFSGQTSHGPITNGLSVPPLLQPSNQRTLNNNSQSLLTNGVAPISRGATSVPRSLNSVPGLSSGLNSIPNGGAPTLNGNPIMQTGRTTIPTSHFPSSSSHGLGNVTQTVPSSYTSVTQPSNSNSDFAIPRPDIFPSVPRTEAMNSSNIYNPQRGLYNPSSVHQTPGSFSSNTHQSQRTHMPHSNNFNMTTGGPISSVPLMAVPSIGVTPSVTLAGGVPNINGSGSLPVGVDSTDYNAVNSLAGDTRQHSGKIFWELRLYICLPLIMMCHFVTPHLLWDSGKKLDTPQTLSPMHGYLCHRYCAGKQGLC